jgi:hypothetical protein
VNTSEPHKRPGQERGRVLKPENRGRLGFSSATNFSKFFHQRTGTSPLAFRHAVRGTAI